MHQFLTPFTKLANDAGDHFTIVHESKMYSHTFITGHDGITKEDALAAIQHIINAYQVTDIDVMGLEVAKTKTLKSYTENK